MTQFAVKVAYGFLGIMALFGIDGYFTIDQPSLFLKTLYLLPLAMFLVWTYDLLSSRKE